ncbi:MAG: hypothetical protein ABJC12_02340 [Saprospiraceae bacterium]
MITDSENKTNFIANTPTRFIQLSDGKIIIPCCNFNTLQLSLFSFDSLGTEIKNNIYPTFGLVVYPCDIRFMTDSYYIFGRVVRESYIGDLFILKIDSLGVEKWIKFFGDSLTNEVFGDVIQNKDGSFSISSSMYSTNYLEEPFGQGWVKPWIFTIDTSGTIVKQWIGNKNDARTFGGGPTYRTKNGDWIIVSTEYKDVLSAGVTDLNAAPTVSRLDTNFHLLWKTYLSDYIGMFDHIADMEYDTIRNEIVVAGQRVVYFNPWSGAYEAWIAKLSADGQILWSVSDTSSEIMWPYADPYIGGLEIAPSGSIYAAGYLDDLHSPRRNYGYLIKVTPDGCMSTLCNTTSINDQIQKKSHKVLVYPNPTNQKLFVDLGRVSGIKMTMLFYTIDGKDLGSTNLDNGLNDLDLDKILSGYRGVLLFKIVIDGEIVDQNKIIITW